MINKQINKLQKLHLSPELPSNNKGRKLSKGKKKQTNEQSIIMPYLHNKKQPETPLLKKVKKIDKMNSILTSSLPPSIVSRKQKMEGHELKSSSTFRRSIYLFKKSTLTQELSEEMEEDVITLIGSRKTVFSPFRVKKEKKIDSPLRKITQHQTIEPVTTGRKQQIFTPWSTERDLYF